MAPGSATVIQLLADFRHLLEIDPVGDHKAEVEEFLNFLEQGG